MVFITCVLLGFVIAASGSIVPSFLNLTVVKFSLKSGRKSAFYLIGGFATVLFFQANIGAYLSSILMENSQYITFIQKIGIGILITLAANFFRLYLTSKKEKQKKKSINQKLICMVLVCRYSIHLPFHFTLHPFHF